MNKFAAALFLAAVSVCGSSWGQALGSASNVNGLVTVTDGQTLTNLQPGQPIPNGSTIITGSNSSVTLQLQLPGGPCSVSVGPGSQVSVSSGQTCAQLNNSVVASTATQQSFLAANAGTLGVAGASVAALGLVARSKLSSE